MKLLTSSPNENIEYIRKNMDYIAHAFDISKYRKGGIYFAEYKNATVFLKLRYKYKHILIFTVKDIKYKRVVISIEFV